MHDSGIDVVCRVWQLDTIFVLYLMKGQDCL